MAYVLRIDHRADIGNQYAQAFRSKLVFANFSTNFPSHTVLDSVDRNAERNSIETILRRYNVSLITASGHGEYGRVLGMNGRAIWEASPLSPINLNELSGKLVHLLCCDSGTYLAHMMVFAGVEGFWGYAGIFAFSRSLFAHPDQDSDAEKFFEMDAIIDRGILSGKAARDIYADVSRYVLNTAPTLSNLDRGLFLGNFMLITCPVLTYGNSAAILK